MPGLWLPGTGSACLDKHGNCATAGTPSDTATGVFLKQLQPYISCTHAPFSFTQPLRRLCPYTQVVDMFHVAYELDLLEVRLHELWRVVDLFIIVESTRTSRLQPKPLFFADSQKRFRRYWKKIIHVVVDDARLIKEGRLKPGRDEPARAHRSDVWDNDATGTGFMYPWSAVPAGYKTKNTIFISGDLDEIPSAELVNEARCAHIQSVACTMHTYTLINNARRGYSPKISKGSPTFFTLDAVRPTSLPRGCPKNRYILKNASFHMTGFLNAFGTLAKEISAAEGGGIMTRYASALERVTEPTGLDAQTARGIRTCCADKEVPVRDSTFPLPAVLKANVRRYSHLFPH